MKKTQLIIALDFHDKASVQSLVKSIGDDANYYKVGLELFVSCGHQVIPMLKDMGKKVFLDLKFHDIPNTASRAVIAALSYEADMINLHVQGGCNMMQSSVALLHQECAKRNCPRPLLIGVTMLTSLDESHIADYKIQSPSVADYVVTLACMAKDAGLDGVVSSAIETPMIKKVAGHDFITVTPGIRIASDRQGDQKRVVTPADAVKMGTDYIVVGRPITEANDPLSVVLKIQNDLA